MIRKNKTVALLLIITALLVISVGCRKEETVIEIIKNNNTEIIKMSEELNKTMHTADNIEEMGLIFEGYKDRIGEQTYLSNFNLTSRLTALAYYREYGVGDYRVRETIVSEEEGITYVYIAYSLEAYIETGEGVETDDSTVTIIGLNKYTYNNNKLVNFNKVL